MIKKYFALTIIAASVSLAACSDDDDDPVVDPEPMPIENVDTGTAYDIIAGSEVHTTLLSLLNGAGLQPALDGLAADSELTSVLTVFAPDNDAFTEYDAAVQATLDDDDDTNDGTLAADFTDAQLLRILQNHVVAGSIATPEDGAVLNTLAGEVAADDTTTPPSPALVAQTLTASIDDQGVTSVSAIGGDPVAVESTINGTEEGAVEQDVVHVVGAILVPSDLPPTPEVTEPDPGTTDPGTTDPVVDGGAATTLAGTGTNNIFLNSLNGPDGVSGPFPGSLDANAWTFFVPNDTVLGAAGLTELTTAQLQAHIFTNSGLDPAALGALTTISPSNNVAYDVVNTDGVITVDGSTVTLIATGDGGAQVYSIDGIIGAGASN